MIFKVSVSIDRYLGIIIHKWSKYYFKGGVVVVYCVLLSLFFLLFNTYFALNNGYVEQVNGTEIVHCRKAENGDQTIINIWSWVNYHFLIKR